MRTSLTDVNCSVARSIDILGDGWTLLILRDVFAGITRFDSLQADLEISRKTLAERLAHLVERGILKRHVYSVHPPRHDYRLTAKGADLFPVIAAIMRWGDRWTTEDGPPAIIRHDCGAHTTGELVCIHCGRALERSGCTIEPGPGGGEGHRTRILSRHLAATEAEHRSGTGA